MKGFPFRRRTARAIAAGWLFLAGCSSGPEPMPFPPVGPLSPAERAELVRARAGAVRTLAAVVQAALEGGEASGSFEIIAIYERPGHLHLRAAKDIIFSARPIFELTFTPDRYLLRLHREDGGAEEHAAALSEFPARHPEMAGLFWTREAMFLPGDVDRTTALPGEGMEAAAGPGVDLILAGITRDGAALACRLDPATLGVRSARLVPPGGTVEYSIEYRRYRPAGEVFLPRQVEVRSLDGRFRMRAAALEVEVNGGVVPGIFSTAAGGGEGSGR